MDLYGNQFTCFSLLLQSESESLSESLSTVYFGFSTIWLNDICISVYFALRWHITNGQTCTLCLVACESAVYFCREHYTKFSFDIVQQDRSDVFSISLQSNRNKIL